MNPIERAVAQADKIQAANRWLEGTADSPIPVPAPFSSDAYRSRTAGGSRTTGYECCLCGRATSRKGKVLHVRTAYGAEIIHPDAEVDDSADSGWFPVGSDCARRLLPPGYTAKVDLDA